MFNVSMAAYLAYEKEKKVCVVDTASGFRGLVEERKYEVENTDLSNLDVLTQDEKNGLIVNPLVGSKVHLYKIDTFENFKLFLSNFKNSYDYLFLDLKGISEQNFDFIMKSTSIFLVSTLYDITKDIKTFNAFSFIKKNKMFRLKNLFILLNKIDIDMQINLQDTVFKNLEIKNIGYINKVLTERKRFDDYSTITGFVNRSTEVTKVLEEIFDIIIENN